uniref:Uncharacterized protein n=1 Tax=Latimeria chalumnae TaxID=7897 RepID=H2ZV20_LATCH
WHNFQSIKDLTEFISLKLLVDFRVYHHGYCFLRCKNHKGKHISQLLILPPVLQRAANSSTKAFSRPLLNINILLLDSLSRHHFYRMLPKTISTFRSLNKNFFKMGQVFDFNLVQAIKGRTWESLQALFAGKAASPFDTFQKPVDLNETFWKFKAYGYETLYIEDMCWLWEWGLVKEQKALKMTAPLSVRAKLFLDAVKRAGIDRVDVSYTSCPILKANKVNDVFHGPDAICYNGFHQHIYLLQYMEYFMSRFSFLQKPAFTFLILDTAHEDTGIRVKQLDQDLARHVNFLANQPNTVSFILSDHGNTYGRFFSASSEAQVEVFHTSLFVIVPDQAAVLLGKSKMRSLHINQHRLVSLLDVHHTLKGLLPSDELIRGQKLKYKVNSDGLLSPVSPNRTCSDIPRIHPNLCICQTYDRPQQNNSYYALFAEFALGHMNRKIQEQQTDTKGPCKKLVAARFDDVKAREVGLNEIIATFSLYVRTYKTTGHTEEGFVFLGFERITPYSIYYSCANPFVDIRLCICNTQAENRDSIADEHHGQLLPPSVIWTNTTSTAVHENCLYLLKRSYSSGVVLAITNVCSEMFYYVHFDFFTKNLYSSCEMPVRVTILPRTETLLVVGIRQVENQPWKYKYNLNYSTQ